MGHTIKSSQQGVLVTNLPRLSVTVTVLRAPKVGAGTMEDWGYWMATGDEDSSDKEVSLSTFDVWMVFSDSLIGNTTWTTSHPVK